MKKRIIILLTSLIFIVFSFIGVHLLFADEALTILHCECNAKANRNYYFLKKSWVGKDDKLSKRFITHLDENDMILRDKIFTDLNSDNPKIKSITPPIKYVPEGQFAEFKGKVIHRTNEMLIIKWENPYKNKIWTAAINLKHKVAVVTQYYNGATSFGVDVETLDCK